MTWAIASTHSVLAVELFSATGGHALAFVLNLPLDCQQGFDGISHWLPVTLPLLQCHGISITTYIYPITTTDTHTHTHTHIHTYTHTYTHIHRTVIALRRNWIMDKRWDTMTLLSSHKPQQGKCTHTHTHTHVI